MANSPGANLYTQGFGSRAENIEVPHIDVRDPTTTDIMYPLGKNWLNKVNGAYWVLGNFSVSFGATTANWSLLGGSSADVNTLTTQDSVIVVPTSGTIHVVGTGNIQTTGSGSTVTISNVASDILTVTTEDAAIVTPSSGNINIIGSGVVHTTGSGSTVTITIDSAATVWPPGFIEGGELTWNGGTPSTISISPLQCVDSTDIYNITVSGTTTLTISQTQSPGWVNGTGFNVVVFADSSGVNSPIFRFVVVTATPIPPSGYNVYRIIGWVYAVSIVTPNIASFWQAGSSNERTYMYDNGEPNLNVVINGSALSGSPGLVDCSGVISANSFAVYFNTFFTPNSAGNSFAIASASFNGGMFFGTADVSMLEFSATSPIMITDANRQLNYYVTNSSDTLSLRVIGFIETL